MSYMRGDPYIYGDVGGTLRIYAGTSKVALQWEDAEDLAVMLVGELVEGGRLEAVVRRAADKHAGNFGVDGIGAILGLPATIDGLAALVEKIRAEDADNEPAS